MDDKRQHQIVFGIGTGLALLFGFLPFAIKEMNPIIAWTGVSAGILLCAWGILPFAKGVCGKLRRCPKKDKPCDEFVSLQDAAREALEAIDGSTFSVAARRTFNAPRGALCFIAERLYMDEVPIYGKQIPSSKMLPIPSAALFGAAFAKDATVIEDDSSHHVTDTDLMVKRSDLDAAIESLKTRHRATA